MLTVSVSTFYFYFVLFQHFINKMSEAIYMHIERKLVTHMIMCLTIKFYIFTKKHNGLV